MRLFRTKSSERRNAVADIVRFVVETSLSSMPETRRRVFGLTGPETCHSVYVTHDKLSPYTLTTVSVARCEDNERPMTLRFYWRGVNMSSAYTRAVRAAVEAFFPMEKK